jgi:hypothetical protein
MRCSAHTVRLSDFRTWLFRRPYGWLAERYSRAVRTSHVAPVFLLYVPLPLPRWTGWVPLSVASPSRCGLPHPSGGSASTTLLSRPAQDSLALRPADLLAPPCGTSFPRAPALRFFAHRLGATQPFRQLLRWISHPLDYSAFVAHRGDRKSLCPNVLCALKLSSRHD